MEYYIVAFKSRNDSTNFYNFLRNNGVNAELINTPKECGVGCGLSVKVNLSVNVLKNALYRVNHNSFAGVFLVKTVGGKKFVRRV